MNDITVQRRLKTTGGILRLSSRQGDHPLQDQVIDQRRIRGPYQLTDVQ